MNLHRSVLIGIAIFYLAIGSLEGVSQATKNPQAAGTTDPPLPIVHFKFETDQVPVAVPSEVTLGLPKCGFKDSALLILFMAKPNYEIKGMYSISSGKDVRTLAIPESTDSTRKRVFLEDDANDSGAYILIRTIRQNGYAEEDQKDPTNYDILRYDDQGTLKETIHPDLKFPSLRIGVFPDGKFLMLGFDEGNEVPRAAILDSGGSYVANVDLENVLPTSDELKAAVPPGFSSIPESMKISMGLNYYQIWHTPSGLALMKQGTNKIILITSGGVVTTVTPKIPKGYTVGSFIQSDNRWLLRVNGPESDDQSAKFDIYEFRSEDGALVQKLDTEPAPSGGFACEQDGEFKLLHWIDKKSYLEVAKPQ